MSVFDFKRLLAHVGHNIECVTYGNGDTVYNVALECTDCNEVLLDIDNDKNGECSDDFYEVENIEWDLDEFTEKQKRSIYLPNKEKIPDHICLENAADYLSDKYGFCVLSFTESKN